MKKALYILIVFATACNVAEPIDENKLLEERLTAIELVDTFNNELIRDSANAIAIAKFHSMYIGSEQDSINLNYYSGDVKHKAFEYDDYKRPDSNDISIFVDTSKKIGSVMRYLSPPPMLDDSGNIMYDNNGRMLFYLSERINYRGKFLSYPLYIKNISTDTLTIGIGEYLHLILEAKDSTGEWRPIQKPHIYMCGTGLSYPILPPKHIALSSCRLYQGDFETQLRIVHLSNNRITSNEFTGKINYSQFIE